MITAKIIADSISTHGDRITSFELEYPRFIHSEFMTHRQFSRNAASSRAIPVIKMIEHVSLSSGKPVHWGKNQPGMQAKEELQEPNLIRVKSLWEQAKMQSCDVAYRMNEQNAHKQIINRILEPFQIIKVVMTTTEIENFFYLRAHADAQPEIKVLAEIMLEEYKKSTPKKLFPGEWHVPYYYEGHWNDSYEHTLDEALALSSSCCAQVSYRKLDKTLDKAQDIYKRLVETKPVHASPFEHQATPMGVSSLNETDGSIGPDYWQEGVTHMDKKGKMWSGNLKGWVQHRQLVSGHVYEGEV